MTARRDTKVRGGKFRWIRRGCAVAVPLLALWMLLVGPWRREWFDESGDARAMAAALHETAVKAAAPTESPIQVGVGVVPFACESRDIPLAGYGRRALLEGNAGVGDPVFAKAVVVANSTLRVAIVSPDLLLVNRRLAEMVLDRVRLNSPNRWTRQQLYFGATHTHSGPGGFAGSLAESLGLGLYNDEIASSLADAIAQSILKAEQALQPAVLVCQSKQVDGGVIRNRTVAGDPANRWLDVLAFQSTDQSKLLASLVAFSAHATCRPSSDMRISADYAGVLCRAVEASTGGPCLFLAGAVGSMGPANDVVQRTELADWLGTHLAKDAVELLTQAGQPVGEPALGVVGGWVPLPTPQVKLGEHWRLSPLSAGALLPSQTWVHALRLGDRILVGAPADYSGVLAEELRRLHPDCVTVATSFNGDYVGYILPDHYYDLPEYETKLCFFGPRFGSQIQEVLGRLSSIVGPTPACSAPSPDSAELANP